MYVAKIDEVKGDNNNNNSYIQLKSFKNRYRLFEIHTTITIKVNLSNDKYIDSQSEFNAIYRQMK